MGKLFVFSILALEHFEKSVMFGNWAKLTIWGFQGQIGKLVNFMLNYGKYAYLGLIGTIGSENYWTKHSGWIFGEIDNFGENRQIAEDLGIIGLEMKIRGR